MSEPQPLQHVAIIPDGNRRWAKARGLPTIEGHRQGAKRAHELLKSVRKFNIKYLTLWGLSTENWIKRSPNEVKYLISLFSHQLKQYQKELVKHEIRFIHIGRKDRLPNDFVNLIKQTEEISKNFDKWYLIIGFDYGGQDEIVRACQKIARDVANGKLAIPDITPDLFYSYTDTPNIPPVDLIIRTSGEKRLSGLYPFQGVYAELYFTDIYFPDFTQEEFEKAVKDYYNRQRRFGGN